MLQDCKKCAKGGYSSVDDVLRDIARENYDWGKYFHYLFFVYRCENMDAGAFNDLLNEDTNKTMQSYEIEHIVPLNAINNGSLKQYGFETDESLMI